MTTYRAWMGMKQLCLNTKHRRYKDYGGRGITLPRAWWKFAAFLADMGEAPLGHVLSRHDFNESFSKTNCYWRLSTDTTGERGIYSNNSSGFKGVTYHRASGRWMAYTHVNGRQKTLGYYDSAESASEARLAFKGGT